MKGLPRNPQLYEINCRVWLANLSRRAGRKLTLGQVSQQEWDRLRDLGMDLVWLMGVWLPSREGIDIARTHPDLQGAYREALPDFTPEDVVGSPYAVADYRLNPLLGTEKDLALVRQNLHKAGLGLVLDFVPNHTARDHPWVRGHPKRYVCTDSPSGFRPGESFPVSCADGRERWVAHGRDPYFPGWTDTAQIYALSPETRSAVSEQLLGIAEFCDGLRCDMAMLVQNRVFEQTWKAWLASEGLRPPAEEYWSEVLAPLRRAYPNFLLMAEVYWGLEPDMLRMGFDYVYDKDGYDRLRGFDVMGYKQGLMGEGDQPSGRIRFLENHDEDRMAVVFPAKAFQSTAVIHATSPCMRLFHHGQLEGRRTRLPVQLGREPDEATDPAVVSFYEKLLRVTRAPVFKEGKAHTLDVTPAFKGDVGFRSLVGFAYAHGSEVGIVAVNQGEQVASGYVCFPDGFWNGWDHVQLQETMVEPDTAYPREGRELAREGLYVRLEPFGYHLLTATR
jgi:hypothetical protein